MRFSLVRRWGFFKPKAGPPINDKPGLWQDPILGYFETHGKMEFKPGEEYDLTPEQKQAVMERYNRKELLKKRYIEQEYNPLKYRYLETIIIDPAVFRWYSANMNNMERFRATPKTVLMSTGGILIFAYLFYRYIKSAEIDFDDICKSGEFLWWDRRLKIGTECGTGNADPTPLM